MVKYIDNSKSVESAVLKKMRGIEKVLINTQRSIVEAFVSFPKPPIDSGQLRQSVNYRMTSPTSGKIIANKDYAGYVEYGTVYMEPRPFFRRGILRANDKNAVIIAEIMKLDDVKDSPAKNI